MITLSLPWPPSVNTYWRHVGPRVLISAQGRQYRRDVCELVMLGRHRKQISLAKHLGPVAVRIEATPPDARARDVDNLLKAPLDALSHAGIWGDDSQVVELTVVKLLPQRGAGGLRVLIWEAEQVQERAA